MSAIERSCENALIAVLSANADLLPLVSPSAIVAKDTDALAKRDRIVVTAGTHEIGLPGHEPGVIAFFRVPISIELFFVTRNKATYDTYIAAINASLQTTCNGQIPDAAGPAWLTAFGGYMKAKLEPTDTGTDQTGGNTRERIKEYHFLVDNT